MAAGGVAGQRLLADPLPCSCSQPVEAARLTAAGATGALVLVEEATGRVLAQRRLGPEPAPDDDRTG